MQLKFFAIKQFPLDIFAIPNSPVAIKRRLIFNGLRILKPIFLSHILLLDAQGRSKPRRTNSSATGWSGSAITRKRTSRSCWLAKRGSSWATTYFSELYELRSTPAGMQQVCYFRVTGRWLVQVVRQVSGSGGGSPAPAPRMLCLHDDDLGSVVAVSSDGGAALGAFSYEPFGTRSVSWKAPGSSPTLNTVTKGFTGHEHDDEFGLINMRGRIFDPTIRRFITPDPFVSIPFSSQSYNPCS